MRQAQIAPNEETPGNESPADIGAESACLPRRTCLRVHVQVDEAQAGNDSGALGRKTERSHVPQFQFDLKQKSRMEYFVECLSS
jgi:hypothetical protein